ncbi:HIRAN domain-containing protein [Mumia sp. DW29H23]|uniref:HIRAN domain-containing protein n=1 Tax=Mumia sp. DW29H23 TaxID=3421241 RepID=UPI003D6892C5
MEINDALCVLVPEPWNPHDRNAVAVAIDGHQVGHLPATLAQDYADPLAAVARGGFLVTGTARIWAKDDAGVVRARVTILIPEAAEL